MRALKQMRTAFSDHNERGNTRDYNRNFQKLAEDINRTIFTFESTSNHAVLRMYNRRDMLANTHGDGITDLDDNDTVFLVYLCV